MHMKKRRTGGKKKRRSMYDSDLSSESDDDLATYDYSSVPKRQSRRQRGLAPEFSEGSNDLYDSAVCVTRLHCCTCPEARESGLLTLYQIRTRCLNSVLNWEVHTSELRK